MVGVLLESVGEAPVPASPDGSANAPTSIPRHAVGQPANTVARWPSRSPRPRCGATRWRGGCTRPCSWNSSTGCRGR